MFLVFLRCLSDFLFVYKLVLQVKFYIHLAFSKPVGLPLKQKWKNMTFQNLKMFLPTNSRVLLSLSSIENCSELEGRADEADVTGVRFF